MYPALPSIKHDFEKNSQIVNKPNNKLHLVANITNESNPKNTISGIILR
jgi:hypothetical protein